MSARHHHHQQGGLTPRTSMALWARLRSRATSRRLLSPTDQPHAQLAMDPQSCCACAATDGHQHCADYSTQSHHTHDQHNSCHINCSILQHRHDKLLRQDVPWQLLQAILILQRCLVHVCMQTKKVCTMVGMQFHHAACFSGKKCTKSDTVLIVLHQLNLTQA